VTGRESMAVAPTNNLGAVPNGESVQIRAVQGGFSLLSRLASLGFTIGAHLRVIQNCGHGPILVSVRDTRVALGRGEAMKILVERVAAEGGNE
jgi:ferrous iron transport protein A